MRPSLNAVPCIEVPLVGSGAGATAIVRCSEILRFFFGGLPVLIQNVFDFSDGVKTNDQLFVRERTKISAEKVVLQPTKRLRSDAHAAVIASFLGHLPSAKSLGRTAVSAREASQGGGPIHPITLIPIDGLAEWTVLAVERPVYDLDYLENETVQRSLMIAHIRTCLDDTTWPEVEIISDSTSQRPPAGKRAKSIPTGEVVTENVQITSSELPGSLASMETESVDMMFDARPNMPVPKRAKKTARIDLPTVHQFGSRVMLRGFQGIQQGSPTHCQDSE